jgi:transcription initiation factor TFIIA large subunit
MPWDPPPVAPVVYGSQAGAAAPATSMPAAPPPRPVPMPVTSLPSNTVPPAVGGVQIKAEPGAGYDLQNLPQAQNPYQAGGAQRAGQLLSEKFGDRAQPQVRQLQALAGTNGPSLGAQPRVNGHDYSQMSEAQRQEVQARAQAYARAQALHAQQAQQQAARMQSQQQQQPNAQPRPTPVNQAQTDGADDWKSFVAERRALAADAVSVDITLRERLETAASEMEGNGSFTSISALRKTHHKILRRQPTRSSSSQIPQTDGPPNDDSDSDDKTGIKDDPDELDEDAINSDLDDSADEQAEDPEEDSATGELMLCTYDKVQRVKNKWKCGLKDGLLSTGGKEYVFAKAQGEFEW